jgi:hypothetical protein
VQGISAVAGILVGLSVQSTPGEDALRLANITINITRHGDKGDFRIDAKITNPNDFTVFDIIAQCDVKDRRGNDLAFYKLTITDAIQAKATRTIRQLDIDQWPADGRVAYCISSEAKKLSD